jgi:hypothetical protein
VPSAAERASTQAATGAPSTSVGPCPEDSANAKATAYQSVSCAGQVASVESRVIRGELLDASTWTWRNGVIRAAVLVGAVAAGIPSFGSKNALKYVGAYNGQLVPGMEVFWPDGTIAQLNHVSDFGFQTNKVFGKGLSDPVYAFFDLDRFLTPGMKDIFLNAPAVFFAPAQIFVDKHMGKLQPGVNEMKNLIEDLVLTRCSEANGCSAPSDGAPETKQRTRDTWILGLLTMYCPDTKTNATPAAAKPGDVEPDATTVKQAKECDFARGVRSIINEISLNSANILVQGMMTVSVAIVPATITDITFDEGNNSPDVWTVTGKDHAATITGSFLTGGAPEVTSIEVPDAPSAKIADYLDATKISVVSEGSTDTKLNFKIQWKKIPSGSKLHFQVTKYDPKDTKKTSGVKSMDFVLPVTYVSKTASTDGKPVIAAVTFDNEAASTTWANGHNLAGNITGSALEGATPTITNISVPSDKKATVGQYIDIAKLATDKSKTNNDSSLHFTAGIVKLVPSGTTITLSVTKNAAAGTEKAEPVTSSTYLYHVNYK